MRLSQTALFSLVIFAFGVGSATADVMLNASSTGVISSGTDMDGTFGGGSLAGDAYTLSIVFDLSNGKAGAYSGSTYVEGGSVADFPLGRPSLGNAVLTIGAYSYTFQGGYLSEAAARDNATSSGVSQYLEDSPSGREQVLSFGATAASGVLSGNVLTPPSGNICLIATCSGSFYIDANADGIYPQVYGTLDPTYTVSVTGAVPEPSAWALMLLGAGTVGGVLRWRERRAALRA